MVALFGKIYHNILLVEPHADDLILSCGSTILKHLNSPEVRILTLTKPNKYNPETSLELLDHLQIKGVECLEWNDMTWRKTEIDKIKSKFGYYDYDRAFKYYNPQSSAVSLDDYIKRASPDLIILPLGLVHPMHIFTSRISTAFTWRCPKLYYLDLPYAHQKRVQKRLDEWHHKAYIAGFTSLNDSNIQEKLDLYKNVYPSQWYFIRTIKDTTDEWFYDRCYTG